MPLSRILWLLMMQYNTKSKAVPDNCATLIVGIQASIGNPEEILCKELQNGYWYNNIYLPWRKRKNGKHT